MGMFTGLAKASVSSRLPDPKLGEADFLLNSMRWKKSARDGKLRISIVLTCVRLVSEGANVKGDKIGLAVFTGDYFGAEIKRWLLACCGGTEAEVEEQAIALLGDSDLTGEALAEAAWENIATLATAGTETNLESMEAGIFDNQVIVRLDTKQKDPKPTGTYTPNPTTGEMEEIMGKAWINTYPQKNILPSSLIEDLDEKEIARFFGSEERYAELCAEEED